MWDLKNDNPKIIDSIKAHSSKIGAFDVKGDQICSVSKDKTIKLFENGIC